jgi:transposase
VKYISRNLRNTEVVNALEALKSTSVYVRVYHHKEDRVTGHLFLTILACHLAHTLRHQLKELGIH